MIKYTSYERTNYINPKLVAHVHMSKSTAWITLVGVEDKLEVPLHVAEHIIKEMSK